LSDALPLSSTDTTLARRFAVVTATPGSVSLGSGTRVATRVLVEGLQAAGHHVTLLAPDRGSHRWLPRFAFNWALSPKDVAGADLVLGLDMDGFRLAGRTPAPFVAYLHGVIADEARFERGAVRLSMQLQAAAEAGSARRATRVLATSEYSRRRIVELYGVHPERVRVAPPLFDADAWLAALEQARPSARRAEAPTVLCVARWYPRKNLQALVEAAAPLARRVPGVQIRVIGDGPERSRLRASVERLGVGHIVRLVGYVPFERLCIEYLSSCAFCLPSLQEGYGLVYAEAMCAERPVVALRASSTPELIDHGVTGVLAEPGDPAGLVDALAKVLLDPELAARLGAAGRARAVTLTRPRTVDRFLETISDLLA